MSGGWSARRATRSVEFSPACHENLLRRKKDLRCPTNLPNEPVHHARERKAQKLLQEVRQSLAEGIEVDDASLTSDKGLLADGRSHAKENSRVGGAVRGGGGSAPSEAARGGEELTASSHPRCLRRRGLRPSHLLQTLTRRPVPARGTRRAPRAASGRRSPCSNRGVEADRCKAVWRLDKISVETDMRRG